jgi:hypothetical protein
MKGTPSIRRVHDMLPDTGLWQDDFRAEEIGRLVNIDHNAGFLIFRHRWSKGGAREVYEAAV